MFWLTLGVDITHTGEGGVDEDGCHGAAPATPPQLSLAINFSNCQLVACNSSSE